MRASLLSVALLGIRSNMDRSNMAWERFVSAEELVYIIPKAFLHAFLMQKNQIPPVTVHGKCHDGISRQGGDLFCVKLKQS